jgi:hypothetical protein
MNRHPDPDAQLEALYAAAQQRLTTSFIEAAESNDPAAKVWLPSKRTQDRSCTFLEAVNETAAQRDDKVLPGLVSLLQGCLKHPDPALRILAMSVLSDAVNQHVSEYLEHAAEVILAESGVQL